MSKDDMLVSPEKIYVKDYKQLLVYKKSVELEDRIYELCKSFPDEEKYRICDQIIRCSTSVSANICEGASQLYPKKYFSFLNNALGSCAETDHWLSRSRDRGYISDEEYEELRDKAIEIKKLMIAYLKNIAKGNKETS
ncbi:four helix bundle protein [Clostridium pasteurianum]|uniref:four helix bundle protein n=1 Tax=Clostridium pasteurianum TaxID=1501 RepID=UPI002260E05C|nr:four helix bundle protein [Clostridium pasteurianum]UZW12865.1 four helix bundle protein [Clostridium pasteurianum]